MSGEQSESVYLARIAELEAEVQALTVELAKYKALALAGASVNPATGSAAVAPNLGVRQAAPPIYVNADGTQGMRRGVSGRPPPASDVGEHKP